MPKQPTSKPALTKSGRAYQELDDTLYAMLGSLSTVSKRMEAMTLAPSRTGFTFHEAQNHLVTSMLWLARTRHLLRDETQDGELLLGALPAPPAEEAPS